MADGDMRSRTDPGRTFSVYTAAGRHKPLVVMTAIVGLSVLLGVGRRRL
jgi:hypothetical protein